MDIYWIQDKKRRGPVTVPDALSLLQTGELPPDTLAWHAGCEKWLPLRELPALADFIHKKPAVDDDANEEPEVQDEVEHKEEQANELPRAEDAAPYEERPFLPPAPEAEEKTDTSPLPGGMQRVYLPTPTARLLARLVDYSLYTALFYGVLYVRQVPYDAILILSANPLLWLPMVALEAALLSTWGTTPGKALMGIRLNTFGEAKGLGYLRMLMRSLMVFTLGMGVMMPQLIPVMIGLSYWLLRRRGITSWDARCSTLPVQKSPAQPSRHVLAIILLYVNAVLAGSCVQHWFPAMLKDIEKGSPELARTLQQYMPEEATPANKTEQPEKPQVMPAVPTEPEVDDTSLPGI